MLENNSLKINIKSLSLEELSAQLKLMGEATFRSKQIRTWLMRGVISFDDMSDLSKGLREKLCNSFYIGTLTIKKKQVSKVDGTVKYLFELEDGNAIESVFMKYEHGNSICVSSQAGCRM